MKLLAITGVPCAGKTTLMRTIIEVLELQFRRHDAQIGKVPVHAFGHINIIGNYAAGSKFDADKITSKQHKEIRYLVERAAGEFNPRHIVFEGERLCNQWFLELCAQLGELKFIVLTCSPNEYDRRVDLHELATGEELDGADIAKKALHISALRNNPMLNAEVFESNTLEDTEAIAAHLVEWLMR